MWQQWGRIFRISWVTCTYVFPTSSVILPFLSLLFPPLFLFYLIHQLTNITQPPGHLYWLNITSLPMSSMVPALEWKEEHHQQSNTSWELRDGLSVVSALPMFFLFTPHSTHRQALSSPYYMQGTDGSSAVLTLTQQVSGPGSRCWAHHLHPRLHRRPPPPTPWMALHQTCDSALSKQGCCTDSTAAEPASQGIEAGRFWRVLLANILGVPKGSIFS